ncbi:MAG: penicillin acylase family protein [Acidimicrobiales bacterium]
MTDADIEKYYLPEDFTPIGETTVEETGRPGTTIVYDEYGIAHVTGVTRADLAFGAGWVTARDRRLLIDVGRGPARAAVADIPASTPSVSSRAPRRSCRVRPPSSW